MLKLNTFAYLSLLRKRSPLESYLRNSMLLCLKANFSSFAVVVVVVAVDAAVAKLVQ